MVGFYAQLVECSVPVLVRGCIFGRVGVMEGSVGTVGFWVVVGLMLGLVFLCWSVEAFTFLEEWPEIAGQCFLSSNSQSASFFLKPGLYYGIS